QALGNGGILTDTFTVTTVDGTAQQITVTIHGTNDAANITGKITGSVTEAGAGNNGTPTATGTLTDSDVDNSSTFRVVAAGTSSDHHYGTYQMTAAGVSTYTLDNTNATVNALNTGESLTDTFTVTATDGTTQQITITIHGTTDSVGRTSGAAG